MVHDGTSLHCLQENGRRQKSKVCETFDHLYAILEERKGEMTMQITSEQEEKLDYIRSLQRKYTEHLDNMAKVLETGINTMDESEMAIFLQVRMSVFLPACRSAPRSICLFIHQCIILSTRLLLDLAGSGQPVCRPDFLSICLSKESLYTAQDQSPPQGCNSGSVFSPQAAKPLLQK